MKKFYLFLIALVAISAQSWAYDFSYTYQGRTLYYNIVDGNAQVTYSSSTSYTNTTGSLTIPSSVTYNGTTYSVTSIGNSAFQNCSGLTGTLTIPNSVTTIGGYAFAGCTGLTSVYYTGDVAGWCGIDFYNDYSNPLYRAHNLYINNTLVTNLVIPNSVTEIKNYAFYGASCLTSVTIPNSVTSIGDIAFAGCTGLTSLTIGTSLTTTGERPFLNCTNLKTLYYNALDWNPSLPSSLTSDYYPFKGCPLSKIYVGELVQRLRNYVLCGSSNPTEMHFLRFTAPMISTDCVLNLRSVTFYVPCGASVNYSNYASYCKEIIEDCDGIDDITFDQIKIHSRGSEIVIEGADNSDALIYDVMGRIVHKGRIESPIHVNNMGVYMVKVGDQQPRKVIVR